MLNGKGLGYATGTATIPNTVNVTPQVTGVGSYGIPTSVYVTPQVTGIGALTATAIQAAIAAGRTPTQWQSMTPAQRTAALAAAQAGSTTTMASMTPILLIGGAILLLIVLSKKR